MALRIKPYILAGGKSSRMGRDKAMLELEGQTLLARAVLMLRSVERFGSAVEVTICGRGEVLEGADRAIPDRYPECGPLGGIAAALGDLECGAETEWACFIPVDMPLLSSGLIDSLLARWSEEIEAAAGGVRACMVKVDGRPQPLVSLVHRSVIGLAHEALASGHYKVVPVLESAGACCTSLDHEMEEHGSQALPAPRGTSADRARTIEEATEPLQREQVLRERHNQFINVNTEADVIKVATLLRQMGSSDKIAEPGRMNS